MGRPIADKTHNPISAEDGKRKLAASEGLQSLAVVSRHNRMILSIYTSYGYFTFVF